MRKTMMLLASLGMAGWLWAADPIIGTWKMNSRKTSGETSNNELTEVYRELDAGQIEITRTGIRKDGSPFSEKYLYPREGGAAQQISRVPKIDLQGTIMVVETLIAPGEWYATFLRDGKQFMVIHKAVSKDGKTMQQMRKDAQGKSVERLVVFDKQK